MLEIYNEKRLLVMEDKQYIIITRQIIMPLKEFEECVNKEEYK